MSDDDVVRTSGREKPLETVERIPVAQAHGGTLHQFPKGVSGNPSGRPKTKYITDAYEKIVRMSRTEYASWVPRTVGEKIALLMIKTGQDISDKKAMIAAVQEITTRLEGSPMRHQDDPVSGDNFIVSVNFGSRGAEAKTLELEPLPGNGNGNGNGAHE